MKYPKPQPPPKPERRRLARSPIARKSKPRKLSKRPAAVARRKADREWAAAVKARALYGLCDLCPGVATATDAHHVLGKKAHPRLRHNLSNGIALCRPCHRWVHANTRDFRSWFAGARPRAWAVIQAYALEPR